MKKERIEKLENYIDLEYLDKIEIEFSKDEINWYKENISKKYTCNNLTKPISKNYVEYNNHWVIEKSVVVDENEKIIEYYTSLYKNNTLFSSLSDENWYPDDKNFRDIIEKDKK